MGLNLRVHKDDFVEEVKEIKPIIDSNGKKRYPHLFLNEFGIVPETIRMDSVRPRGAPIDPEQYLRESN